MIYFVIGQSGAGKSTFVQNNFLKGTAKERKDLITLTESDTAICFGEYTAFKRKGTDTTTRNDILEYLEQIKRLRNCGKDIVLDGNRISGKLLYNVYMSCMPAKVIWLKCSLQKSIDRAVDDGLDFKDTPIRAEATKNENMFWRFAELFDCIIIDTEDFENVKTIERGCASWYKELWRHIQKSDKMEDSEYWKCFVQCVQYPSAVKIDGGDGCYRSRAELEHIAPKIISGEFAKNVR